jgi:hypothetical protein
MRSKAGNGGIAVHGFESVGEWPNRQAAGHCGLTKSNNLPNGPASGAGSLAIRLS